MPDDTKPANDQPTMDSPPQDKPSSPGITPPAPVAPIPDVDGNASPPPLMDEPVKDDEPKEEKETSSPDLPPVVTTGDIGSKKKSGGKKMIATILGVLLLIGGIGAGVFLVGQQQDIREKASGFPDCTPRQDCGANSNTQGATLCHLQTDPSETNVKYCCPEGLVYSPSQNACISTSDYPTCTAGQDCGGSSTTEGASPCRLPTDPDGALAYCCSAGLVYSPSQNKCVGTCANPVKSEPPGDCTSAGGQCLQIDEVQCRTCEDIGERPLLEGGIGAGGCGGTYANVLCCTKSGPPPGGGGGGTSEVCGGSSAGQCQGNPPGSSCQNGAGTCKNIGTDSNGNIQCSCNTGGSQYYGRCLNIKAYDTSWTELTATDLSALSEGDVVRFAVSGETNIGEISKARFVINGVTRSEVTQKRPGSDDFYDEYTIPAGRIQFSVNAQLFHSIGGWF